MGARRDGDARVAVVMSTYNGARYLREQLDSVLAQEGVGLRVVVRDDGSTDETLEILADYARRGLIELHRGENLGATRSFLEALRLAGDADHYAFCDQDDLWHRDKLARALAALDGLGGGAGVPLLYCSEYNFCDRDLAFRERSRLNRIGVTFPRLLYENVCSGNTMVFNRALARMVVEHGAQGVYCHDWWVALIAACFGRIVYDEAPCLEYRRTGGNASPTGAGGLELLAFRVRTFLVGGEFERINEQNRRFLEVFGEEMDERWRRLCATCCDGPGWLKASFPRRLRQRPLDELALRALLLLGR